MRPGLPSPHFSTSARRGREEVLLAIGATEEGGPISVYCFRLLPGGDRELVYIYNGNKSYGLWRAYMEELARLEEGDWQIERSDRPRRSETEGLS